MRTQPSAFLPLAALLVAAGAAGAGAQEYEDVHRCDEIAAHPDDPGRWAEGVADDKLVPGPAIKFCTEAAEQYPDTARFHFQLGRSLWAGQRHEEAVAAFLTAEEMEYAPALAYLGDAYLNGVGGVEQDEDFAITLYQMAAEAGFAPAEQVLDALSGEVVEEEVIAGDAQTAAASPAAEQAETEFNPQGYNQPGVMEAFYTGDFSLIPGRDLGVMLYVDSFNKFFSQQYNFHDPTCVLLYKPAIQKRVLMDAQTSVLGGGSPEQQGMNALELMGRFIMDMQRGGPQELTSRAMNIEVLKDEAEKDAIRLTMEYGCESEVTKKIYANMEAFVLGGEPILSPAAAQRRQLEQYTSMARQSCVERYANERFCGCMIEELQTMEISNEDWETVGQEFSNLARIGSRYPGVRESLLTCNKT